MTAALAAAKVNVDRPHVEVAGVQSMRNSVEVKNSCNCFQSCFPCFKPKKKHHHHDKKTQEVAHKAIVRTNSIDDLARSRHIVNDSPRYNKGNVPPREISHPDQLEVAKRASAEYKDPIVDVHIMVMGVQQDLDAIKELRAGDT